MYDPVKARFLSPDTMVPWLTYSQAHNRYIYVMGNPLRYSDPTGHEVLGTDPDTGLPVIEESTYENDNDPLLGFW